MNETFLGKYPPGTVFQYENHWYVADTNDYISGEDALFADDVNDVQMTVGWYTDAHLATSEQDLALVAAHLEAEARKQREYHAKWDPIHAQLAEERAQEEAVQKEQQRQRIQEEFPIGVRVRNSHVPKLVGVVIAHHETEPKLSVQWDGEDHPSFYPRTTSIIWYGLFDQKVLREEQ